MRILLRMPDSLTEEIQKRFTESGRDPEIETSSSTSHVLERLSDSTPDLLLISSHTDYLRSEVLGACDLFGVSILALTDGPEAVRYAEDLGLAQHLPQESSWADMLAVVGLRDIVADDPNHDEEPSEVCVQEAPGVKSVSSEFEAQIISVWGPTGAPGRTTIAIALAGEFTRQGRRVLLVDADTYGGTISLQLGLGYDSSGLASACRLAHNDALTEEALVSIAESVSVSSSELSVLTGISDSGRWPELSESRMTTVLALVRNWFDVIVVDVGFNLETDEEISSDLFAPRRNAATLTALRDSDSIVAVCGADSISLARFMRMHRELAERFTAKNIHTVINKATNKKAAGERVEILARFGGIHTRVVLPEFSQKNEGTAFTHVDASKEFSSQVVALTTQLLPAAQALEERQGIKVALSRRFARQGK